MREIGKVKWFGGYNAKTERENNFGFLARREKPDLYIHREQTPKDCVVLRERDHVRRAPPRQVRVRVDFGRERAVHDVHRHRSSRIGNATSWLG